MNTEALISGFKAVSSSRVYPGRRVNNWCCLIESGLNVFVRHLGCFCTYQVRTKCAAKTASGTDNRRKKVKRKPEMWKG